MAPRLNKHIEPTWCLCQPPTCNNACHTREYVPTVRTGLYAGLIERVGNPLASLIKRPGKAINLPPDFNHCFPKCNAEGV